MPENNEPQYELDHDYAPIGIVDAADGSGTTWPEFVEQVGKMDNQVAALTKSDVSLPQSIAKMLLPLTKTATVSKHYSVPANGNVVIDFPQPSGMSGFTVSALASMNLGSVDLMCPNYVIQGGSVTAVVRNISNAAVSGDASAVLLGVRTTLGSL